MDIQTLINTVLPLICVAIGWFCKNDVHELRSHLAENYVHKSDFADRWEEVLKAIHRIEDKLDQMRK